MSRRQLVHEHAMLQVAERPRRLPVLLGCLAGAIFAVCSSPLQLEVLCLLFYGNEPLPRKNGGADYELSLLLIRVFAFCLIFVGGLIGGLASQSSIKHSFWYVVKATLFCAAIFVLAPISWKLWSSIEIFSDRNDVVLTWGQPYHLPPLSEINYSQFKVVFGDGYVAIGRALFTILSLVTCLMAGALMTMIVKAGWHDAQVQWLRRNQMNSTDRI